MQINPDDAALNKDAAKIRKQVSIVSIHADQSRLFVPAKASFYKKGFQSYQFMQINPDNSVMVNRINSCRSIPTNNGQDEVVDYLTPFQSYQFMQINPDEQTMEVLIHKFYKSFNRINSCRSIPTFPHFSDMAS